MCQSTFQQEAKKYKVDQNMLDYAEVTNNPIISLADNNKGLFLTKTTFPLWFGWRSAA